jgi:hypothetical protein
MAKYHSAPFKEGEIFFYPTLGALSNFEDSTGSSFATAFGGGQLPKLNLVYSMLYECHKVACARKGMNAVSLDDLKIWVEGKEVMKIFSAVLTDLLEELGIGDVVEEKKT